MTIGILFIAALPVAAVLWFQWQAWRIERVPAPMSRCEAASLVRRTLAEMGVEVEV